MDPTFSWLLRLFSTRNSLGCLGYRPVSLSDMDVASSPSFRKTCRAKPFVPGTSCRKALDREGQAPAELDRRIESLAESPNQRPARDVIKNRLQGDATPIAQESSNTRPPFVEAGWICFGDPSMDHVDSRFAFRKRLELATPPKSALVRVTADARYQLWVNGQMVSRGPARGFPWAQPYDEHDLAPFLLPGTNWIAAKVYQFGDGSGAFGQSTRGNGVYASTGRTGLLIEGEVIGRDGKATPIRTDTTWQARPTDCGRQIARGRLRAKQRKQQRDEPAVDGQDLR